MSQWRGSHPNNDRNMFYQHQRGSSGFGIAPLMRPVGRGNFYGGSNNWNSQGSRAQLSNVRPQTVNRGGYRTPGRGEVIRMGPSKPLPAKTTPSTEMKLDDVKTITTVSEIKKEEAIVNLVEDPLISKISEKSQETEKTEDKKCEVLVKPAEELKPIAEIKKENPCITLDPYNSELHIHIEENGFVGSIMRGEGFEYMWGGVRATHGVIKGKVCFEVHLLEELKVSIADENDLYIVRVGWSIDGSDYQLGEDKFSWGYGGTAKSSNENKFRDYGKRFGVGDTVTCYIDLDASPKAIFYMVNGEYLGVAFRFTNELTKSQALFPHIACKNMKFRVNFGAQPPKFPLTNGFFMIQNTAELISPPPGPTKPEEAEIIMMVGLPGSGKSFWCEKYASDHKDKKYYILGTNFIIDRMKVSSLSKKRNYHGRWEELIKRASAVLNKLFDVAKTRPKNYILDQTNVYFTARRRKMESFRGYKRIAAVLINKPLVLADRIEKQKKIEGKFIPDEAVIEMKRNFTLPEVGPSFDEVWYIEETMPMARELVENYRKEGENLKHSGVKRSFPDSDDSGISDDKKPRSENQQQPSLMITPELSTYNRMAPVNTAPNTLNQHIKDPQHPMPNRNVNSRGFQNDRVAHKPSPIEVEHSRISPRRETRGRSTSLKRSEGQLDSSRERINSRDRAREIRDDRNERDILRRDDRKDPFYRDERRESIQREDHRPVASKDDWSDHLKGDVSFQDDRRHLLPREYKRDIAMRDDQRDYTRFNRDERNDRRGLLTKTDCDDPIFRSDRQGSFFRDDLNSIQDSQRDTLIKDSYRDFSLKDQSKIFRDSRDKAIYSRSEDINGLKDSYRDVVRDAVPPGPESFRGNLPTKTVYESYLRENVPYPTKNEYQDTTFKGRDFLLDTKREYSGRETRDALTRDFPMQERDLLQRSQDFLRNDQRGSAYDNGSLHPKSELRRRPDEINPLLSREDYRKLPSSATPTYYSQRIGDTDGTTSFREERYSDSRVSDFRDMRRSSAFQDSYIDSTIYPKNQSSSLSYDSYEESRLEVTTRIGGSKSEDYSKQHQFSDIRFNDASVSARQDPYQTLNNQPLRKPQDSLNNGLLGSRREQFLAHDQAASSQQYANRSYAKQEKDFIEKYSYHTIDSKSKDDGYRVGAKSSSYYDQGDAKPYQEMSRNDNLLSDVKGYSLSDEYDQRYSENRGIRNNKSDIFQGNQAYSRDHPDVKLLEMQRGVDSRYWNERSGMKEDSPFALKSRQPYGQEALPSKYQSDINTRETLYKRNPSERFDTTLASQVSLPSYTATHTREDFRDRQLRNEGNRYGPDSDYLRDQQVSGYNKQTQKSINDVTTSQSYQTQMTTSTANYQPVKYTGTSLSAQSYGREQGLLKSNEPAAQSTYNQYTQQASSQPISTTMPQKPTTDALPGSQTYEQQQQDYQKAYSQWYANYAQAFAQLAQQNLK